MEKDYYKTLGVGKDASADEIKSAFRKSAMKYHPDRNQGDKKAEEKFKEINEAYEILKDDQKRADYDRYGTANFQNAGGFHGNSGGFEDFSDVFGDIFGDFMGRRSGARPRQNLRGADLRYDTAITLEEDYTGIQRKIKYTTAKTC